MGEEQLADSISFFHCALESNYGCYTHLEACLCGFLFFFKKEGIKTMQNCVFKIQKQLKNVTLKELSEGSAH